MRPWGLALTLALVPAVCWPATPTTAQRLELLERRVSRVTDLTLQLDHVRSEYRQLRGQIESLGHQIEQLKRKQRDMYLDIDQRLGSLSSVPATRTAAPTPTSTPATAASLQAPATTPTASSTQATQAAVANADPAQVQAEYQAAYELLSPRQKRYGEAAKAFAAFLQKYPDDALAPNAQYWLGEAHYVSQHNADAQQAFETVVARYPGSSKAPGALFKIGRLQQAAGETAAARASYEKVLSDYPDSPAAGLARQRLDALGR